MENVVHINCIFFYPVKHKISMRLKVDPPIPKFFQMLVLTHFQTFSRMSQYSYGRLKIIYLKCPVLSRQFFIKFIVRY